MATRQSPIEHPIVIYDRPAALTDEQLEEARDSFRMLVTNYQEEEALVANMSMEQQLLCCQDLVRGVFALAGLNSDDHPQCYAACVDKCVATGVPNIRTWSSWGGYREFAQLANDAAAYTEETHKIHLPNASFLVAAMAVRKLRKFEPRPEDQLAPLVISFRMLEHLQGAIKAWTPTTPVIMHTTLDYEKAEGQAEFDNPQRIELTAGLVIDIEEDDPTTNMAGLTVECQEFDQPFVKPRVKDTRMVAVHIQRSLTRDQVALDVDETMDQLAAEFDGGKSDELLDRLTEHMVAVMSPSRKHLLSEWAALRGKEDVVEWVDKAKEDKSIVEWIEAKLVPEDWSDMVMPYILSEELLDIAKAEDMDVAVRRGMTSCVFSLRHYLASLNQRHRDKANEKVKNALGRAIKDTVDRELGRFFQTALGKRTLAEAFDTHDETTAAARE